MPINFFNRFSYILFAALALAAGGCSSGGGGGAGASCVSLPAGDIAWTMEVCGPLRGGEIVYINSGTQGQKADGGAEALGGRSVNKGRVTWTVTNMDYTYFPWPTSDVVMAVFMGYGQYFREANWHILGNRLGFDSKIETRLVNQRFDLMCVGGNPSSCEKSFKDEDRPRYSGSSTYRFDCSWDTTVPSMLYGQGADVVDGLVECSIYDVTGGGENLIQSYVVPTSGPFNSLNYFAVGGKTSSQVGRLTADIDTTLTNVRFTVFQ